MPTQTDEELREKVLDVADRLYYGRGIQAVGMDALRAEAGVSLKRLYQLFPSKESIVEEVLHRRRRLWNGLVEAAVATGATPRDRLLAVYDMLARWFDDDDFRGCVFINTFGELGATAPRIAQLVREHKAHFQAALAALVAEAGGPASLASQLAILAEGAQTTAAIAGTSEAAGHARAAAATLIDSALTATRAR
ncbi:TetR/AcrR family transcriptional regulator [Micromonospora musae]|uniref:TetR/AcrR family transcriptional regulator n=1 Tax=Micromonospora musae TaxID=1894970 RepID=A0A3A9YFE7_9ACTN|nr:TetR/AcrR family transcriptional regulator [Micromonospora musae]RKN15015.1 TetR/AcrR family transcriptional regulator [Micromonospora musae]RKN35543.1 TetR/AcrR family transcriptional regulator [Micromonospora musae]